MTNLVTEIENEVKTVVADAENVMRHTYKQLTDEEKALITKFKDIGLEFYKLIDNSGYSRELSLSKTKIEEAVMWAVKHITG